MSTKRVDHFAEAEANLTVIGDTLGALAAGATVTLADTIAIAQVQATLALVEQQRIANMQTERRDLRARVIGRFDDRAAAENARAASLDVAITEALGLS